MRQGHTDGQEDEVVARLLAPVCSSGCRRFRKLVRIHELSPDIAGCVHVGEDDLEDGAGEQETGGTNARSLLIGFDAVSEIAILSELKHREVVTTIRTSGFEVETVQCKDLGFILWGVGGQDKIRLWPMRLCSLSPTHSHPSSQLVRARSSLA